MGSLHHHLAENALVGINVLLPGTVMAQLEGCLTLGHRLETEHKCPSLAAKLLWIATWNVLLPLEPHDLLVDLGHLPHVAGGPVVLQFDLKDFPLRHHPPIGNRDLGWDGHRCGIVLGILTRRPQYPVSGSDQSDQLQRDQKQ